MSGKASREREWTLEAAVWKMHPLSKGMTFTLKSR